MPYTLDETSFALPSSAEFHKKNILQRLLLEQKQLEQYYRELRKYEHNTNAPIKGVELRKKIHCITVQLMKIERAFLRHSLKVIGDERIATSKPKIYAVTHIGRYDIETSIEAIKENAFFVWGDPGKLYKSPEKLLLNMIGMIFVDTDNKEDRQISLQTMIKLLKQNGNIIIFPEGAWNITENEPVTKLYTGAIEAAILGGAEIIPVAIDHYGADYYVNIGRNIDCSNMKLEDKREESDKLRDILSTLKWQIWEEYGAGSRADFSEDYSEIFLNEIMKESDNGYTIEEINRTRFKDKNITTPEEAFEHLSLLKPNKNNAFLLQSMTPTERERQAILLKKRI